MVALLPPELMHLISQQYPCREVQILQLATYYNPAFPSPPVSVAYGLEETSKTEIIVRVLEERDIQHAVIRGRECLSQRHLLSKIFASCISALGQEADLVNYDRVDSLNALLGNLRKIFEGVGGRRLVLVLEGTDQLKQAGPTLLPALARLGDQISGLSIILTSNSSKPLALHKAGVVYIHFPPYTRAQAVHIVTSRRATFLPSPLPEGTVVQTSEEVLAKIYTQFAITVYDTLISPTASTSIRKFQSTCNKLWPRFIWPLVSGQEGPGTGRARSWDFAKLLVHSRGLFQSAGEKALHHALPASVLDAPKMTELHPPQAPSTPSRRPSTPSKQPLTQETLTQPPLLKHFPTLVLLSCYLASHTLPKHDILLFSRLSSSSSTTSKKIRRLRQTPTKRKAATNTPNGTPSKGNAEATTPTKSRSSKSLFAATANLGIPRPFTLERLVAILRAVHPHGIPNRAGRGVSDRVYRELGELEKLRLVVRSSGSSGGGTTSTTTGGSADDSTEEKWRVNVRRDWAVNTGHAWGMGISEYETEQDL